MKTIAAMAVTKVTFVRRKLVPTSNSLAREPVTAYHNHGFVMVRENFRKFKSQKNSQLIA